MEEEAGPAECHGSHQSGRRSLLTTRQKQIGEAHEMTQDHHGGWKNSDQFECRFAAFGSYLAEMRKNEFEVKREEGQLHKQCMSAIVKRAEFP
jgi:hypothetical protein